MQVFKGITFKNICCSESLESLRTQFPLNLYLVGKIQIRSMMRDEDSMISFKKSKQSQSNSSMDLAKKCKWMFLLN